MARNGHRYLDQFFRKGVRAIERGRAKDGPNAFHIPANQGRAVEAANLVNLLRFHGIEVQRATQAFKTGGMGGAAGGRPRHAPSAAHVRGQVSGVRGGGAQTFLIAPTTESGLIQFRFALRDVRMFASEDSFTVDQRAWGPGTTIIPATAGLERRISQAAESLGLNVTGMTTAPRVARHELDLPRIALVHSWLNTQNEGWVRYAFDVLKIPYTYLSVQQLNRRDLLRQFNVLVLPYVSNNSQQIVNGLPLNGPPIPWRRSALTPNLGGQDSTDDVRPGIGLEGMAALSQWIAAGGVVITEGGTSAVFTDYGVTRGVDIVPAKQLRASGGIYRAVTKDARSPIAYGYADTLAVYFNQSPLFQVDTSTDIPEDQDPDLTAQQARMRPRVVMSFDQKRDSLRLSGLLVNGEELAGRPAVLHAPVGQGQVVRVAVPRLLRGGAQGGFGVVVNTSLSLE